MNNEVCKIEISDEEITDCYSDLISVEVEEDNQLASVCNIRFAMPFSADNNWKWIDEEVFMPWNKISIYAGFSGGTEKVFTGYITHINTFFSDSPSQSYLDIRGMDESVKMNREDKVKSWPNKKDSDIANEIFKSYGFKAEVVPTEVLHDEAISTIIQNETDMQFLQRLAQRNGFECFVRDSVGYFRLPEYAGTAQKVLAVNFGSESNVTNIQFEVNMLTPANIEIHQLNPLTRENMDKNIESVSHKKLGKQNNSELLQSSIPPAKKILTRFRFNGFPSMQAFGQAIMDKGDWLITGNGEIIGKYYQKVLKTRELVTIKGVGELYSGNYRVSSVRHHFSGEGYAQHFSVKRNAVYPDGTELFTNMDSII